jgi:hypothetical protein
MQLLTGRLFQRAGNVSIRDTQGLVDGAGPIDQVEQFDLG